MRTCRTIVGAAVLASACVALTGCGPREDESVRGKMWYRPSPPPPRQANTIGVGRYGEAAATYDSWGESGTRSGSWDGRGASAGRWNSTGATYSTWGPTGVIGEPLNVGRGSGVVGYGGITATVTGGTASYGSYSGSTATYGTIP